MTNEIRAHLEDIRDHLDDIRACLNADARQLTSHGERLDALEKKLEGEGLVEALEKDGVPPTEKHIIIALHGAVMALTEITTELRRRIQRLEIK